ncbi:MAG: ABC transporter substrate-binding protein [Nitrospira sp.]|nr:ABC transporter substrate-binding protein [Nitrospira sp.]
MTVHTSRGGRTVRARIFFVLRLSPILAALWCLLPPHVSASTVEITILKSSGLKAYDDAVQGFKATTSGTPIYTEYDLQGDAERGKQLAGKIRASDSSLIVAVGLKAALIAKQEITDIPILYMMILDPVKHHLTAANMTGVLLEIPADRQFKIMRTFLPTLRRIATLYDREKSAPKVKDAEARAAAHEFQLRGFPVDHEKDVPQQLRGLLSESDALWLIPDSTVLTDESTRFILEAALAKRVPVVGFSAELTRLGALLSLSIDYGEVGREAGLLARRILNGEPPLRLKPVSMQRVRITVNQKTARYLSITFPKELDSLIDDTY